MAEDRYKSFREMTRARDKERESEGRFRELKQKARAKQAEGIKKRGGSGASVRQIKKDIALTETQAGKSIEQRRAELNAQANIEAAQREFEEKGMVDASVRRKLITASEQQSRAQRLERGRTTISPEQQNVIITTRKGSIEAQPGFAAKAEQELTTRERAVSAFNQGIRSDSNVPLDPQVREQLVVLESSIQPRIPSFSETKASFFLENIEDIRQGELREQYRQGTLSGFTDRLIPESIQEQNKEQLSRLESARSQKVFVSGDKPADVVRKIVVKGFDELIVSPLRGYREIVTPNISETGEILPSKPSDINKLLSNPDVQNLLLEVGGFAVGEAISLGARSIRKGRSATVSLLSSGQEKQLETIKFLNNGVLTSKSPPIDIFSRGVVKEQSLESTLNTPLNKELFKRDIFSGNEITGLVATKPRSNVASDFGIVGSVLEQRSVPKKASFGGVPGTQKEFSLAEFLEPREKAITSDLLSSSEKNKLVFLSSQPTSILSSRQLLPNVSEFTSFNNQLVFLTKAQKNLFISQQADIIDRFLKIDSTSASRLRAELQSASVGGLRTPETTEFIRLKSFEGRIVNEDELRSFLPGVEIKGREVKGLQAVGTQEVIGSSLRTDVNVGKITGPLEFFDPRKLDEVTPDFFVARTGIVTKVDVGDLRTGKSGLITPNELFFSGVKTRGVTKQEAINVLDLYKVKGVTPGGGVIGSSKTVQLLEFKPLSPPSSEERAFVRRIGLDQAKLYGQSIEFKGGIGFDEKKLLGFRDEKNVVQLTIDLKGVRRNVLLDTKSGDLIASFNEYSRSGISLVESVKIPVVSSPRSSRKVKGVSDVKSSSVDGIVVSSGNLAVFQSLEPLISKKKKSKKDSRTIVLTQDLLDPDLVVRVTNARLRQEAFKKTFSSQQKNFFGEQSTSSFGEQLREQSLNIRFPQIKRLSAISENKGKVKQRTSSRSKNVLRVFQDQDQSLFVGQRLATDLLSQQKTSTKVKNKQREDVLTFNRLRTDAVTDVLTDTLQANKFINLTTNRLRQKNILDKKIKKQKVRLPKIGFDLKNNKDGVFVVTIGKPGNKNFSVKIASSLEDASRIARNIVSSGAAASLRITQNGKRLSGEQESFVKSFLGSSFRKSKTRPDTFVEKNIARINTAGEKIDITLRGLQSLKRGRVNSSKKKTKAAIDFIEQGFKLKDVKKWF